MKLKTAFRNLDRHGEARAPEVIAEEIRQLEPHLSRFRSDLVQLEATAAQTRGKTRIEVRLRLQLPSGVIVAHEEGFEIEPVLRKAFADLRRRVDRHVSRLTHESEWKRPARRRRIGAPLPEARDAAEAERRALFFDLVEEHLDRLYDTVRRELTYLEASGSVPEGYLNVNALVDATILKGLERFEERPTEFSVGAWLTRLAFETIESEARAARRVVPEGAASIEKKPELPAEEPTESDQEMFEFYQPDEVLLLEDLIADDAEADPEQALADHETALAVQRALAGLPALWRRALLLTDEDDMPADRVAEILGLPEAEVTRIVAASRAFLRDTLRERGLAPETAEALGDAPVRAAPRMPIPQPLDQRARLERALRGGEPRQAEAALAGADPRRARL